MIAYGRILGVAAALIISAGVGAFAPDAIKINETGHPQEPRAFGAAVIHWPWAARRLRDAASGRVL